MAQKKAYDKEYKIQAVKLGREIVFSRVAAELDISADTLYGWNKKAKSAELDLGSGSQTPETATSLAEEVQQLRKQNREQEKEIKRLKEENSSKAEASAFFAASRMDLKQSGVYFLFGVDEKTERPVIYIGQAGARKNGEGILNRLYEHRRNVEKDYWTDAVVITTSNNSFGPTEISYLENYFCNLALGKH